MEGKDLLALLPCPVKTGIEDDFIEYMKDIKKEEDGIFDCIIEANVNKNLAKHNFIDDYKNIEDIPSIIISSGINDFYGKNFYNKFIKKEFFNGKCSEKYQDNLAEDFAKDPGRSYNIIAMNVLVIVVDLTRIGDRKIPISFEEVLDPVFENSVGIRGEKTKFCETTLLAIYKEYGLEGIERLKVNIKRGYHPSEMVQAAGENIKDAPAIYVMPYFYSQRIKKKNNVEVIWPKEGGIVSPITMLIKKESESRLKKIIEFFMGSRISEIFSNADFITFDKSITSRRNNEERKYLWPGWDYILNNDIKYIVDKLNKILCE